MVFPNQQTNVMGNLLRPDSCKFVNLDECKSPRLPTGLIIVKLLCCFELDKTDDLIEQLGWEPILLVGWQ